MKPIARNSTPVYARQHSRTPTLPQLNAIDLLAAGKTDQKTADLLKLHRTTVTKWRLYDPVFQAALNRRRAEIWGAAADRLRSLVPKALDVLADALTTKMNSRDFKAAVAVLRLASPAGSALTIGPTDPDEIVRQIVHDRRERAPGLLDGHFDERRKGLSPLAEHVEATWRELEALANDPAADSPAAAATGAGLVGSTNT
jgi:hypothetical protein